MCNYLVQRICFKHIFNGKALFLIYIHYILQQYLLILSRLVECEGLLSSLPEHEQSCVTRRSLRAYLLQGSEHRF